MIGLEALGMSLEDIFITIVDTSEEKKKTRGRVSIEKKVAQSVMQSTAEKQATEADTRTDKPDKNA